MKRIISERHVMVPSHYHVIKDLEDRDIKDLSRVIENSIVSGMSKGKYRIMKIKQAEVKEDTDDEEDKKKQLKKQLVGSVKYGISEIDSNLELKKFIID